MCIDRDHHGQRQVAIYANDWRIAVPFFSYFIITIIIIIIIIERTLSMAFSGTLNSETQAMAMAAFSLLHVIFYLGTGKKLWMDKLENGNPYREANEARSNLVGGLWALQSHFEPFYWTYLINRLELKWVCYLWRCLFFSWFLPRFLFA